MFRGYRGSLGLLRGLFNPFVKRNLSTAPIRYVEDKKKVDGMFSWLKDMLKPDAKATEAGNAIDRKATPFDYPRTNRAMLGNFELEDRTGRNFTVSERSFNTPEPHEPPPVILLENRANLCGVLPTCDPKLARNGYRCSPLLIEDSIISILNPKRNYHSPFPRHEFLTVASPVRTITGCTPRNTKPPIREPNMPEKLDKKEDKKEKKQKKPVIRMEGGGSKSNETIATAESGLHDNMDVNLRYQWGTRLPEESEKNQQLEAKRSWNEGLKQLGGPNTFVGDSKRSGQQISPSYDMDALRTMKDLHLTMSSTKETDTKVEGKTEVPGEAVAKAGPKGGISLDASKEHKEAENVESFAKILDTAPNMMMETNVVDEDYNVPSDANFDAEIAAWKDLVLKSKVPIDPAKQEFLDTGVGVKRAEMLSIRPEPPEPKLDVQAVPTANDELMKDEVEEDVSKDFKGNLKAMDVNRTINPSDVQKVDSKKLHTGPIFLAKRYSNSVYESRRKTKLREPLWTMELMDNDANFITSGYSTKTEDGWKDTEPTVSKEAVTQEPLQSDHQAAPAEDQDVENNISDHHVERLSSNEAQLAAEHRQKSTNFENQDPEAELADSLNAIDEREIEMSLSQPQQERQLARDHPSPPQRSSKKYEAQDFWRGQSDTFHDNFEYGTTYEDDFYAGYESMSMEPPPERPNVERNRSPAVDEHTLPVEEREVFNYETEPGEPRIEYITEGKYIKIPGDPYPYSPEHFNKWRMKHEDINIGPAGHVAKDRPDSPAGESSTGNLVEIHQPVRKMSYDSRVWGMRGRAARR